jgi:hypothetical protein
MTSSTLPVPRAGSRWTGPAGPLRTSSWRTRALEPAVLVAVCAAAGAATYQPLLVIGTCLGTALVALVWVRPVAAAYLLIGLTPLVAGIDRGVLIPVLRPNEALELLMGATLAARWLVGVRSGGVSFGRLDTVSLGVLLLAVTNSVTPLAAMAVRGREITTDDILYSLVLWKLLGLYWIIRASVRTAREVRVCLVVSLGVASIVAVVGVLQSLDLLGVRGVVATYYAQFGNSAAIAVIPRGGSTLSLPAATADLLIMNLAVLTGLWLRERWHPVLFGAAAALLTSGTLAAGEFSSALGLVLAVVLLAWVSRSWAVSAVFGALGAAAAVLVWPVIAARLQGFSMASGVPPSWLGRWHNLTTYFWPELFSRGNVLLGVRPSARVPAEGLRTGWVWIESGYTWLLWGGGIPLFLSFLYFTVVATSRGWSVARSRSDAVGAAGTATFVGFAVIAVLMVFDPHLTYRGSADEAFVLLALTAVPPSREGTAWARRPTRTAGARPAADDAQRTGQTIDDEVVRT